MLGLNKQPIKYKKSLLPDHGTSWYEYIEQIPGVIRFNNNTLPYLSSILGRFQSSDPYLTCPAYHSFTGRHGLWGYARGGAFLLFSKHPNQENTFIIFPQFGRLYPNLAIELIQNINLPDFSFVISRVPSEQADFITASLNKASKDYLFKAEIEKVLDWTYPVQSLSTKDVVEAKGKYFKNFRNLLHRVDENEIHTELINPINDEAKLKELINIWASNKRDLEDTEETVSSYLHLLKLIQIPTLNLSGLKFYKNGELVAFEIWALPAKNKKIANNLAGMNINAIENLQGFSAYQYHTVCKTLLNQGIEYVCIGGSETENLDRFKRKMNPINSLELKSIAIYPIKQNKVYGL